MEDFDQLAASMRRQGSAGTMTNLLKMSEKLKISVQALPKMLEDYADVFLSVAYYQEILDHQMPGITEFLAQMRELQQMPDLRRDKAFSKEAAALESSLYFIIAAISSRFESFNRTTEKMWGEIDGASFEKFRKLVIANQTLMGGVLCALTVKMRGWEENFSGQPLDHNLRKRVQFIQNEMRAGIESVEALETSSKP